MGETQRIPNAYTAMKAVLEYSRDFRRQDLPTLEVSELYDLFPDREHPVSPCWPEDYFPNAERAGVYFFFDERLNLLYVGKASMSNCLGNRLGAYFKYEEDGKTCRVIHEWSANLKYLATVAVPPEMPYEAPALEEFLISRLKPPDNSRGKSA